MGKVGGVVVVQVLIRIGRAGVTANLIIHIFYVNLKRTRLPFMVLTTIRPETGVVEATPVGVGHILLVPCCPNQPHASSSLATSTTAITVWVQGPTAIGRWTECTWAFLDRKVCSVQM